MYKEGQEYKFNPREIKIFQPSVDWMKRLDEANFLKARQQILYPESKRILEAKQDITDPNIIPDFPINKPVKFDRKKMIEAIEYGLVILINYRGDEDKWRGGRERTIQPMVMGINKNTGNLLIRGWHLEGWSVSNHAETKKVWRLFKAVNIMTMTFTGNFFRLPPKGYKMNDRLMTETTIARADFNVIRRNQSKLLDAGKIQSEEETTLGTPTSTVVPQIEVTNSNSQIDLKNPWVNTLLNQKDATNIKISILRSVFGKQYIACVGAIGTIGRTVKVYDAKQGLLGNYKTVKAFIGSEIKNNQIIDNQTNFDLYVFNRKL